MTDIIVQFLTMISFMGGIIIGEMLVHRVFGRPKSKIVMLIDIIGIAVVISVIYSYIEFYEVNVILYAVNLLVGLFVIIGIRGIEWSIGLTEKELMSSGNTLEIIRTLAHYGLDHQDIVKALKRMGMSTKVIEEHKPIIERSVPAYVPRFMKMEKALERIEKRLKELEKR